MQHSRTPVGSMTKAMNAVRTDAMGPKVLRIGVLTDARISEERVVRENETVTIGTHPSCTIVVTGPDAPEKHTLFARRDGRWSLSFAPKLEGRALVDGKVRALTELFGAETQLSLDDGARGKVTLAGVSVLFQFVAPPPVAPKPQLPQAILHKPLREQDWRYNACLAGFMALGFAGMGYVEYGYDPEVEAVDIREEVRLVRLESRPAESEPTPSEAANASETPSNATPTPSPNRNSTRNQNTTRNTAPSTSRQSDDQRVNAALRSADRAAEAAMRALDNSTDFRAIANAIDGNRSAVAMLRNGQALMDGSVEALANSTGIRTATNNNANIGRTGLLASNAPNGNTLGRPGRIDGPGEIATTTAPREERIIRTRVTTSGPTIEDPVPGTPTNEIVAVFRRNIGGVQSCYTRALRNNPDLRGRIEISFSIGTTGRVIGSPRVSGIANADELNSCVAGRVRTYVFPVLEEATPVMFPVTLEPGG
jgi:hypothetical protein